MLMPVLSRVGMLEESRAVAFSAWVSEAVGVVACAPEPEEPADVDAPLDVEEPPDPGAALRKRPRATAIDRVDVPVSPSLWVTVSVTV